MAPRPKEENQNKESQSTITPVADDRDKQLAEMQLQMLKMQELIEQLTKEKQESKPQSTFYEEPEDIITVSNDKPIRVMSLRFGGYNLKTHSGIPIRFEDFGRTKTLRFEDVRGICENYPQAAREGFFIILDKDAVAALYLEEDYKKILTKQKIEKIVDLSSKELLQVLENTTEAIQQTIFEQYVRGFAANDNRYLDFNKIKVLNDFFGEEIEEVAKNFR